MDPIYLFIFLSVLKCWTNDHKCKRRRKRRKKINVCKPNLFNMSLRWKLSPPVPHTKRTQNGFHGNYYSCFVNDVAREINILGLHLHLQMPLKMNMYTSYYALNSVHYTPQCLHCILQMYHFTLTTYKIASVGLNIYMAKYSLMYTVYSIQYTAYSIQYTVYSIQCTVENGV